MRRNLFGLLLGFLLLLTAVCPAVRAANSGGEAERLDAALTAIREDPVGKYGMVPIYGRDIADGTYPIRVTSSSSFFKIVDASLQVAGDTLTVSITIPSLSYQYVYPGTAEEAEQAGQDRWIEREEADGQSVFTLPIQALDFGVDCAAFSVNRQKWYDRALVFDAASLPPEALNIDLPDYDLIEAALRAYQPKDDAVTDTNPQSGDQAPPEPVSISQPDGEYSIEVNMTGGSGRASISSPTLLTVRDGKAYAKLIWSSAYYDYMLLEGTRYDNLTTDGGNSAFEIPITALDAPIPVVADTTAMGDPVEIDYTLTFYEDTVGGKGDIPQEAAKKVLVIALAIILGGGALNHVVKKKRKGV